MTSLRLQVALAKAGIKVTRGRVRLADVKAAINILAGAKTSEEAAAQWDQMDQKARKKLIFKDASMRQATFKGMVEGMINKDFKGLSKLQQEMIESFLGKFETTAVVKVLSKPTPGTAAGWTYEFDAPFKNKVLKADVAVKAGTFQGFAGVIPAGSLISNIPGGVFAKYPEGKKMPAGANATWGVQIIRSKENLEAIAKQLD